MSELVITPNFDRKTARFKGIVAAGEHASVRIVGAGTLTTATLRLRVVFLKKTLAVFPLVTTGVTPDEWEVDGDDLTCTINLNTAQMQKELRRLYEKEVLFVLDDPTSRTLHFADLCVIRGWPQEEGADTPVDLDGYSDFVADTKSRLNAAESAIESNAASISAEATARQAADAQHTAAISGVSDVVSVKADASALEGLATKDEVAADKAELEAAIADKQDAGDYLTEHQSLAGLATTAQVNAAIANKANVADLASLATKEELESEAAARAAGDEALADADEAHDEAIEELAGGIDTAEAHITNHALDTTRHLTSQQVREHIAATLAAKNYNFETTDGLIDAIIDIVETLGGTVHE